MNEPIKHYQIKVTVKNNYLLRAISDAGYKNIADFARKCNLHASTVSAYVSLAKKPIVNEKYTDTIVEIADALNTVPENLFPPQHLRKCLPKNRATMEADTADVEFIIQNTQRNLIEDFSKKEMKKEFVKTIAKLPSREVEMIKKVYFEGKTLMEAAKGMGKNGDDISLVRARQIVAKGERRLKHPLIARNLREFLYD